MMTVMISITIMAISMLKVAGHGIMVLIREAALPQAMEMVSNLEPLTEM